MIDNCDIYALLLYNILLNLDTRQFVENGQDNCIRMAASEIGRRPSALIFFKSCVRYKIEWRTQVT